MSDVAKMIDSKEYSYKSLGKGLIVLSGGTVKDKLDAIAILYEKYGVQNIDSSEMANLCEGLFGMYEKFDPKVFQKLGSSKAEIASCTATNCWKTLNVIDSAPIAPNRLEKWISNEAEAKESEGEGSEESNTSVMTKYAKETEFKECLENALDKLSHNKDLFNVIYVILANANSRYRNFGISSDLTS